MGKTAQPGTPLLFFATPRSLPDPASLPGRVVVLDIAFAAAAMGTPFEEVTRPFIDGLGDRLAAWVDHHDHQRQAEFAPDQRFVLASKAAHGGCPEMVSPELVAATLPVDSIVCHLDLDGLYAAAKWLRGGREPYPGADADARAVDTRLGEPSQTAAVIDQALRAHFRDQTLKIRIVRYLEGAARDAAAWREIEAAAADLHAMLGETRRLLSTAVVDGGEGARGQPREPGQPDEHHRLPGRGRVAMVDARSARGAFDKTELLLGLQRLAEVAIIRHAGMVTLAASFDSGYDFLRLLSIEGGMPTRVSLPEAELPRVLRLLEKYHGPT